jgi:hypothetical protein
MTKLILLIILFLIGSCSINKTPNYTIIGNDTLIKVLTYGYPPRDYFQRNKVARKYGYIIESVAKCEVNQQLIDSVKVEDEIAFKEIEKLNGKDWQERYERDVEDEFKRDSIIVDEVEKLDFIKEKEEELKKSNNGLNYFVDSILADDIYQVNVTGYLVPTTDYVSYYRVFYNYSNHEIDSVGNKIIFMFKGQ